jgi:hypothetical protein
MICRQNLPSNFSYAAPRRIADASARRSVPHVRDGQAPTFSTRQFHPKTPKNVCFCQFSGHFAHFSPIFTHFRPFPPFFPRGGRRALQAGSVSPPARRPSGTWRGSAKGRSLSASGGTHRRGVRGLSRPAGQDIEKNGFEGLRVAERHDLPQKLPEQFFLRCAAAHRGRLGEASLPFQSANSTPKRQKTPVFVNFGSF